MVFHVKQCNLWNPGDAMIGGVHWCPVALRKNSRRSSPIAHRNVCEVPYKVACPVGGGANKDRLPAWTCRRRLSRRNEEVTLLLAGLSQWWIPQFY